MAGIPDIASFLNEYQKLECGIRDKNPLYYWWIPLDRPILAACKDHPAHSDYCEVYAKVALVNRMYSAQLGKGKMGRYEAEDKVAQALCKSNIDIFIQPLFGHDALTVALGRTLSNVMTGSYKLFTWERGRMSFPFPRST